MFAMPSHQPEGLGLVFLEAMACSVPVIASRAGGTPEIVTDGGNGLLIERNDEAELARAMRRLLDDPALRGRLGAQGRETAARHGWRAVAMQYLEVYQQSIRPRAHANILRRPPPTQRGVRPAT